MTSSGHDHHHDFEGSKRSFRSASPSHRPAPMNDRSGRESVTARERPTRIRQRQRSCSPGRRSVTDECVDQDKLARSCRTRKERVGGANRRRTRRVSNCNTGNGETVDWSRPSRSPGPHRTASNLVASRQVKQIGAAGEEEGEKLEDSFGDLAAQHRDAKPELFRASTDPAPPAKPPAKRASKIAAIASSKDIDAVIAQFRDQCDVHMATLLELKNNITTTEKAVVVDNEKDKEFQQVRQWYSALAEKHNKLQKEHQALQEEHVKLQEKYMNLKRANSLSDSFVAHFDNKDEKKKDKRDKGKLEVVWSRAGKITKQATNKLHQVLVD